MRRSLIRVLPGVFYFVMNMAITMKAGSRKDPSTFSGDITMIVTINVTQPLIQVQVFLF